MASPATGTDTIDGAVHVHSGKVRDLYAVGDDLLLMVASDRISAFDWVLPTQIPDKGAILTGLTLDEERLDAVCRPERYLERLSGVFDRVRALT